MTVIVATAGLTTALGTATLLVGDVDFFRAFAPALALTAVVGVVVSVTLLPALLAILGRGAFWPRGVGARPPSPRRGADPARRSPPACSPPGPSRRSSPCCWWAASSWRPRRCATWSSASA